MERKYADIIIDISHEKLDKTFQYVIPERLREKVEVGTCVCVPFGKGNRLRKGYVAFIGEQASYEPEKLKEIADVEKNAIGAEERCIALAAWMKEQYGSTLIAALKTVLPIKQKVRKQERKSCRLLLDAGEAEELLRSCERKRQTAKARLLKELIQAGELPMPLITGKLHISSQTIKSLEGQGAVEVLSESSYRNPVKITDNTADARMEAYRRKKCLNDGQRAAADGILADFDAGRKATSLIHGITGSGKTEVYLEIIEGMIERGRQAIVLIPEIALTYQTVLRFYARFGDRVSVMNSTLSQGEKYDQCERAKKGEIDVMIGPRSALFTPFSKLGAIIIDEEHEGTYKSESMPKYHARETAEKIASMQGAVVVLGSATPSLEAYYRAKTGKYRLYELKQRQPGKELPSVWTVDLRDELRQGNRSIFSRKLRELLEERLERGEQSILFLNRRGYAGFVSCRSCGYVMKCPHCDVSLSEHAGGKLVCHYCGYTRPEVNRCPECGSKYILGFRAGTQQIEEAVHREFPKARVLRMDADSTRTKDSYEEILNSFANGEADILLGTQMIVKGHDFPDVTLVGILAADLSLHVNDYRAGERTFQLLTQAAGRAGRGKKPGEVVIQTYDPGHYSIVHAARQDYQGFYEEEMMYREMLLYPPAAHMLAILTASPVEEEGMRLAEKIGELLRKDEDALREDALHRDPFSADALCVIGPAAASVGKIQDIYRFMVYVKHMDGRKLIEAKNAVEAFLEERQKKGGTGKETVQFDFDPLRSY